MKRKRHVIANPTRSTALKPREKPHFLKRLQREADFASLAAVSQIRVALTIKRMRGREDVSTE